MPRESERGVLQTAKGGIANLIDYAILQPVKSSVIYLRTVYSQSNLQYNYFTISIFD